MTHHISKKDLEHLAKLHALLGSPNEPEANAARRKLLAFLAKRKMTWNDLTERLKGTSAEDQQRQRDEARAAAASSADIGDGQQFDALALVHRLVETYLDVAPHEAIAIALWILHTHVYEQSTHTPRLALTSPVPGCGKSQVLKLAEWLGRLPERMAGTSPAAIYHLIERQQPTLLVDEADNLSLATIGLLRTIFNEGYERGGGIPRVIGGEYHKFPTFAPMAIAAIGSLPLPLMQRSIVIHMHRSDKKISLLPWRGDLLDMVDFPDLHYVYGRIRDWAGTAKLDRDPHTPKELRNRPTNNWRPLLAIADAFGEDALGGESWGDRAREAALTFARTFHDEDAAVVLLDDCRTIFNRTGSDRMTSDALVAALLELDTNWSWSEWRGVRDDRSARKLTAGEMARLLRPFDIRPRSIRMPGVANTRKGYMRQQFEAAWARYCPTEAGTPAQSNVQYLRPAQGGVA